MNARKLSPFIRVSYANGEEVLNKKLSCHGVFFVYGFVDLIKNKAHDMFCHGFF